MHNLQSLFLLAENFNILIKNLQSLLDPLGSMCFIRCPLLCLSVCCIYFQEAIKPSKPSKPSKPINPVNPNEATETTKANEANEENEANEANEEN